MNSSGGGWGGMERERKRERWCLLEQSDEGQREQGEKQYV